MTKADERTDPNSCWNKAKDDHYVFVLIETDEDMPGTIRDWVARRIKRGRNKITDPKIQKALAEADAVEKRQRKIEHS